MKIVLVGLLIFGWSYGLVIASEPCASGCCVNPTSGDINSDGSDADIVDLTSLADFLFGGGPTPLCDAEADVNGDGAVADIVDLTYIAEFLFGGGPAPVDCPWLIRIIGLTPGAEKVSGAANIVNPTTYKVVLYAKTDKWYVQPSTVDPFTDILSTGLWTNSTYPWDRMIALLVDGSYVPSATKTTHPSLDPGVLGYDEYPESSAPREISWSGYCWKLKVGSLVGPGPNYFSDDTANIWIDGSDRLHLKIDYRDGLWYCAEAVLEHSLGYGTYRFKLDSRVDNLDYNTVLGGFVYETINREFDIEFSKRLADPFNAQYVAQPWYTTGNIVHFDMPPLVQTTHQWEWDADRIFFQSWLGHADAPTASTLIYSWKYTGPDNPPPGGERMIFNLYLFGGEAPINQVGDEIIIKEFEYVPLP
jgi:hypothetical protein